MPGDTGMTLAIDLRHHEQLPLPFADLSDEFKLIRQCALNTILGLDDGTTDIVLDLDNESLQALASGPKQAPLKDVTCNLHMRINAQGKFIGKINSDIAGHTDQIVIASDGYTFITWLPEHELRLKSSHGSGAITAQINYGTKFDEKNKPFHAAFNIGSSNKLKHPQVTLNIEPSVVTLAYVLHGVKQGPDESLILHGTSDKKKMGDSSYSIIVDPQTKSLKQAMFLQFTTSDIDQALADIKDNYAAANLWQGSAQEACAAIYDHLELRALALAKMLNHDLSAYQKMIAFTAS